MMKRRVTPLGRILTTKKERGCSTQPLSFYTMLIRSDFKIL